MLSLGRDGVAKESSAARWLALKAAKLRFFSGGLPPLPPPPVDETLRRDNELNHEADLVSRLPSLPLLPAAVAAAAGLRVSLPLY